MFNKNFNSIVDVITEFSTEKKCIKHLEKLYWNGKPVSPFDETSKVYQCKGGRYKCKNTQKYFTAKTGTMFDGTKVELKLWFAAVYLVTSHKKGISSLQLARDLSISQKTAWFMLHRIRKCFGIENQIDEQFAGTCEADETFVGGKNKNRHKNKKVPNSQGRSYKDKTPIVGIIQRGETKIISRPHKQMPHITVEEKVVISYSKVRTKVVANTKKKSVQPFVLETVARDTRFISDEWYAYRGLDKVYNHHVVDHRKKQYVDFDNPEIHSNSIESFWGILKRGYNGIYNWWSPKHMQKYSDEFTWRFNLRGLENGERFKSLLLNSTVRTKYKDLVNA